ncbi:MAG: bifunctional diaminohydroxyphosphoribosylaminopyrimidine deaminase/5-amino-6-(5-phosphoribosylamino)uracil reductase RibD [Synergistaceae bacterium]|nr:bifunctional diaminohydroxyphosphoribosylaminopyrimidine deaminase/5-amino-6-(5-phosphoribosylamino)uracil reductase RibD [Synergistaceae bacterium]
MVSKRVLDEYYMSRALSLAWRGLDAARPNPMVGCVLVKDRRVIGEGWHDRCGGDHAEVAALKDAAARGESARGATACVTLEPCSHFGKTPPCAPRLIEEGIARVVVGMTDPNPEVNGAGLGLLRAAGVEVSVSCMERECRWLNRGFIRSKTRSRPWITLKAAVSLDGRMALENGESRWITGPTARTWAHLMRAGHHGILAGAGTILKDDPELTVRHTCGKSPLRIILDTELSLPPNAKVMGKNPGGGCLVLTCSGDEKKRMALEAAGAEVCVVPSGDGRVDLEAALREIAARDVQMLMIEGGPAVLSSFIRAGLCDAMALFTSSSLMGSGPGPAGELRFELMQDVVRLRDVQIRRAGDDMLVEGVFRCSPAL